MESANGDTVHKLINLSLEYLTIPGGVENARRRSRTRENPMIISGVVEYTRRKITAGDNPMTLPGGVEYPRRKTNTLDNPETPGNIEDQRRRSSTRESILTLPSCVDYRGRRKGSIRLDSSVIPGNLLSRIPSLKPSGFGSDSSNVRSRKASVALLTIPDACLHRGSIQVQSNTKTRSNTRRGSRTNRKEKLFQPLKCFRRIARIVRTLLRVGNALKSDPKRDLGEGICKSFLEMMEGYMMMKNKAFITNLPAADTGPALFDPTLFKANKEIQISKEVRNILNLKADERTPEQLQTVLYACQTLSSFAELPLHMQESICKVAWHQSLPANKIIIKQGHLPENFYFIMSGTVTVLSENDPSKEDESVFTSLATLRRGTSFGDTAILKSCRRTATVVSKVAVHLLVINREDFQRIFMGRSKDGEEPRHIKFCRTLDFLTGFPIDLLIDNQNCMFHYFRRGTVIVKDSLKSEWVYIVVSGMCEVLLNLEAATPKLTGKQIDAEVSHVEMLTYLTEERYSNLSQNVLNSKNKVRKAWDKTPTKERVSSCDSRNNKTKGGNSSHRRTRLFRSALSESAISTERSTYSQNSAKSRNRPSTTTPVFPVTDMDDIMPKKSKKPVFVRIDIRHPRSVFGLSNLDFENTGESSETASVSLVSRGAECVMISKKFFVAHAREQTKAWIRHNANLNLKPLLCDHLSKFGKGLFDWPMLGRKLLFQISEFPVTLQDRKQNNGQIF